MGALSMATLVMLKSHLLSLELNYLIWKCERLHKKWLKSQNAIESVADGKKPENILTDSLLEIRPMSIELIEKEKMK